ncbi:MAG: TonB-dependent siderophore receptor [Nostoc sp.]|uniref:TonB-dependent siderophore receptor n=1 Tax=Nostoc sp. TaxID=1180 RepID=UPI002FFC047B
MKGQRLNYFFWQSLLLSTSLVVSVIEPVRVVPILAAEIPAIKQQLSSQATITKSVVPIREIRSLDQIKHPLTDAQKLVQSTTPTSETETVSVTGVKINSTDKGLEVILGTGVKSERLQVTPKTEGNSYIADIPNAQLRLSSGESFRQLKPAAGITEVSVTNINVNTLRVTVMGEDSTPAVQLFDSPEGLVFGVISTTSTAQQPTLLQQKPPSSENQAPIELEVTAPPETDYNPTDANVGTRTNTPLRDIPQTVNVIPQQVIKDQRALTIGEALRNVGVVGGGTFAQSDRLTLRGSSTRNILTDGLRNYFTGYRDLINIGNIERIEVLRGPASVLYGQGDLGGTINLVTKQPLIDPFYAASFSVGSYDTYQGTLDLSGPLTTDKSVLYRLNGSYLTSTGFVDFYNQQRSQIAGALAWNIGRNTKLTFNTSYADFSRSATYQGIPALGTLFSNPLGTLPRTRFLGEPGKEDQDTSDTRLSYKIEHHFNDNWSIENAFQAIFTKYSNDLKTYPLGLLADNRTLRRDAFTNPGGVNYYIYDLDTHVTGRFKTGSIEHQVVFGTEYAWNQFYGVQNRYNFTPIDIFNPVYGNTTLGKLIASNGSGLKVDNLGVYAQDLIALSENLKLVLGGRYDWTNQTNYTVFDLFGSPSSNSSASEAFSPRLGIVYQPIKPLSLYASYSRSFIPQTSRTVNNELFKPDRGTQYEVGVKADLLGDKLSVNLALFQLTESNVPTVDLNNPGYSIPVGEVNTQGVELFITGEILPGWNVIASYAYADPRITKDNSTPSPVGKAQTGVPLNQASLWTTYTISKGNLQGLGGGIGVFYVGDRYIDTLNTLKVPSYVRTDAALFYRWGKFDAILNFENLFDLAYFEGGNNTSVTYGSPFTATLTLGWKF